MRNISRKAGVTVLAAARRDQNAAEIAELGHGLFTYILLTGLDGPADNGPRDGKISAHEIVQYSERNIPMLSRRYLDDPQEPVAFVFGTDFALRRHQ